MQSITTLISMVARVRVQHTFGLWVTLSYSRIRLASPYRTLFHVLDSAAIIISALFEILRVKGPVGVHFHALLDTLARREACFLQITTGAPHLPLDSEA